MWEKVKDITCFAPLPSGCTQLILLSSEMGPLAVCPRPFSDQLLPRWTWGKHPCRKRVSGSSCYIGTEQLKVPKGRTSSWSFSCTLLLPFSPLSRNTLSLALQDPVAPGCPP